MAGDKPTRRLCGGKPGRREHPAYMDCWSPRSIRRSGGRYCFPRSKRALEIVASDGSLSQTFGLVGQSVSRRRLSAGLPTACRWIAFPVPTWTWQILPGVRFEKKIWMPAGQNTTYITYTLREAPEGARRTSIWFR